MRVPERGLAWISRQINAYYHHPAYQPLWEPLHGKSLEIGIAEMGTFYLECQARHCVLHSTRDTVPAAEPSIFIHGPLRAFMRLGLSSDLHAAKALGLTITGDLEAALCLTQIWKHPPIDTEERLSAWIGDPAAHRLGRTTTAIKNRLVHHRKSLLQTLAEYWQEETPTLPSPSEMEDWMRDVDDLRDRVACLEAKIAVLRSKPHVA